MKSDNISSHELDEWEDVCRFHGDARSMMILRLIGEVRQCWSDLERQAAPSPADRRANLKLVVNGTQELSKDG